MGCIIGVLVWDVLSRQLLGFFIFRGIEVAGDLEINGLHMGVNCLHQLPHAGWYLYHRQRQLGSQWEEQESGMGFVPGSLVGSPRALPTPEGQPTTPPRTLGPELGGQQAPQSSWHLQSLHCTTCSYKPRGLRSDRPLHQHGPGLSFPPVPTLAPFPPAWSPYLPVSSQPTTGPSPRIRLSSWRPQRLCPCPASWRWQHPSMPSPAQPLRQVLSSFHQGYGLSVRPSNATITNL